jgi:uncharacterized protein YjaZ
MAQDVLINPLITPEELAVKYKISVAHVNVMLTRMDFREFIREARGQLIDPAIATYINGGLAQVIEKAMQVITAHLNGPHAHEYALRVLHATTRVVKAEINENGVRVCLKED